MKMDYRVGLNIAPNERILFRDQNLKGYAVGVVRSDALLYIKVLGSVVDDFRDGPDDLTYWPTIPVGAVKLATKVYDILQHDDWQNRVGALTLETWRT